jgi:glutamate/aspartate transport system substrate-binding protein
MSRRLEPVQQFMARPKTRGRMLMLVAVLAFAAPAAAESTLEKAKRTGTLAVAYRETSMPFSYIDANGVPTGFGYDICLRIAEEVRRVTGRADLKVIDQPVTSVNRIPLMQNGTSDVECSSTTNNSERQKQVAFSINYFYTGTRLLVKAGSPVRSFDDLRDQVVVSTAGTTNLRLVRNLSEAHKLNIELLAAKDPAESALAVQSGRAVAYAMDDIILYFLRASSVDPLQWAVVGEPIQVEPYAIMFRRDDPSFKQLVDATLTRMIRSGEFEKLYDKWFMSPIPPKGVNLQIPMSRELRENLKALSDKPAT